MNGKALFAGLGCLGLLLLPAATAVGRQVSEQEAYAIGKEAFTYLYPLVIMDLTRSVTTSVPADSRPGMGPSNAFHHMREFPDAGFREVVRPNFDTLYSSAWLDLTEEPMIVSAPDTGGRYYLLPMLDMWTDVFAVPGKRTSGTGAASWAVVGPGWSGTLPGGVGRIDAPTPFVWIIGRTQTNGVGDYAAVHAIQDGYTITPLSRWGMSTAPAAAETDPAVDMKTPPLQQVNSMPASVFFARGAGLMKLHPPHVTDWSILARMKRIGLEPGRPFDMAAAGPAVQSALEKAAVDALREMQEKIPTLATVVNGWQMNTSTMGVYGNGYLKRAIVAMIGLGANQAEDAVYPLFISDADGRPLNAMNRYVLHFAKEELPPVGAFWSLTMYDAMGYPVPNPLNRFSLGDRDPLKYSADGSLDIYIQHGSPGGELESNWLPAPKSGEMSPTLRLYAPGAEVLDGRWNPPPVRLAR